jgi:hypothetical protein
MLASVCYAIGQNAVKDASGPGFSPNLLTCSPAPCVLRPTQVSSGPYNVNNASIVVDPSNPNSIIVGANDWNCGPNGFESLGFLISLDAGSDWRQYCPPGFFVRGQEFTPGFNPIQAYDRNGVAYIGGFYASGSFLAIGVQSSRDGMNWSVPAPAIISDKYQPAYCWMAADTNVGSPHVNSLYVSCVMLWYVGGNFYDQLVVAHSSDGGSTWQQVNVGPPLKGNNEDLYTSMAVGKDGTVYLSWQYCSVQLSCLSGSAYPAEMAFSKSSDGGMSWSAPTLIAQVTLVYPLPNAPNTLVINTPAIAVDASDGAYAGTLYATMYNWTGTFMQVQVLRSTDGGSTWSKPVPVAPGITHDQFFPWIAVSPTGLVGVSWLDRRNDPANVDYQAYAGISQDGGLTFEPNIQLTKKFSNPNVGGIGNYNNDGSTWDGPNYFLAAWMDQSNGINSQDVVGGIRLK